MYSYLAFTPSFFLCRCTLWAAGLYQGYIVTFSSFLNINVFTEQSILCLFIPYNNVMMCKKLNYAWQTSHEMGFPSFRDMNLCHIQEERKPQLLLCESPEPIKSSLLAQVSSSNTVLWNSLNLCSSLGVRDEVPCPYKLEKKVLWSTACEIMAFYSLMKCKGSRHTVWLKLVSRNTYRTSKMTAVYFACCPFSQILILLHWYGNQLKNMLPGTILASV